MPEPSNRRSDQDACSGLQAFSDIREPHLLRGNDMISSDLDAPSRTTRSTQLSEDEAEAARARRRQERQERRAKKMAGMAPTATEKAEHGAVVSNGAGILPPLPGQLSSSSTQKLEPMAKDPQAPGDGAAVSMQWHKDGAEMVVGGNAAHAPSNGDADVEVGDKSGGTNELHGPSHPSGCVHPQPGSNFRDKLGAFGCCACAFILFVWMCKRPRVVRRVWGGSMQRWRVVASLYGELT